MPPPPSGPPITDARPLSPAQVALFETPHLDNVTTPETLIYDYHRTGPAAFTDTVAVHIRKIRPNHGKDVSFDYLTGERRVHFPELDDFHGNPLLMLVLDRDVAAMKEALGLSASFFRNRIRESFVSDARLDSGSFTLAGKSYQSRSVVVQPFAHESRLERVSSVQAKTYTFVLSDAVPGGIAEIRIETPADTALQAPAMTERVTFNGVQP